MDGRPKRSTMTFCLFLALAGGLIAVSAATGGAAGQASTEPACLPLSGAIRPDETRTVQSETEDGLEATQFLRSGFYQVSRCTSDGTLLVSQVVGPLAIPDGKVALVPYETVRRNGPDAYLTSSATYGSVRDPRAEEAWRRYGKETTARVIPPTTEP